MKSMLLLIVAVALGSPAQARSKGSDLSQFFNPNAFRHRALARRTSPVIPYAGPVATYDQKIDHFTATDMRTFRQRYVLDSTYAKAGAASPVVLYVCGEGNCIDGELGGFERSLAQSLGANIVALEHRFYGESQPFAQMTAANLSYLTIEQAIEDLAEFQKWIVQSQGLTGKWVAIGGSYPADLAAIYRMKHPELVSGAIASSACAQFSQGTIDADRVAAQTAGPTCTQQYRKYVLEPILLALGNSKAMAPYKRLFDAADVTDDLDFIGALTGMAIFDVQEYGAKEFCASLSTAKPLEGFASHFNSFVRAWGTRLIDWSYAGASDPTASRYQGALGFRQWVYQGCTQIGVFSAAIMKANPNTAESFSSILTDPVPAKACGELFGLKQPPSIDEMNKKYYKPLLKPTTSNILFLSGSNDPACFPFSISKERKNDTNPNTRTFTIKGGSHCMDLQPENPRETGDLKKAHDLEKQLASEWTKP